jgi:chaperonin GroEL
LYDGKIVEMDDIVGILETVSTKNKSIMVIAHEVEGQALATMVVNAARGVLKCVAVKAPGFGSERSEMLRDMAALTGGTLFGGIGKELEEATFEDLGNAERVVVTKNETVIVGGAGSSDEIKLRIDQIKHEIEEQKSDFEKEKLHKRLSKISGGVAVLRVGAQSEVEMKEKKDRIDDALLATKAAVEEGIVPGGGASLIHARLGIDTNNLSITNEDEELGYFIVLQACKAPFLAILSNAGLTHDGELNSDFSKAGIGFDVINEKFVDMMEVGIIDPTKVSRTAIEKAVSVAGTLLTTECMIVNEPKEVSEPAPEKI